jgi:hypothetical protein
MSAMVGAGQDMLPFMPIMREQLMFMDPEPMDPDPITSVAMEVGAIPVPPPPQAVSDASRVVAAHSHAAGSV